MMIDQKKEERAIKEKGGGEKMILLHSSIKCAKCERVEIEI